MASFGVKYFATLGALIFTFGNFIACGSQMYQVSVHEDVEPRAGAANQETNDPTSTLYGIHASFGWDKLPIPFRFGDDLNEEQKVHLLAAMKHWETVVGKPLFKYTGTHTGMTGDSFNDLYSSLSDRVNGHYLDTNWAKTGKPDHVLATTIWNNGADTRVITDADIRFNNEGYIIGDSLKQKATRDKEVVDMQSLALHELGHLLGLAHISADIDSSSIMNPSLFIGEGLTTRRMSRGDIEKAQVIYGCTGDACDIDNLLEMLEKPEAEAKFLQAAAQDLSNLKLQTTTAH